MRELSIREMRAELGRLGRLLETEGEIVITRHGDPIARVLPLGRSVAMAPEVVTRKLTLLRGFSGI